MPTRRLITVSLLACLTFGVAGASASAQVDAQLGTSGGWQRYDWLKPAEDQQRQAASGESLQATTRQDVGDPFAVVSNGALWQQKYGVVYSRRMADTLSLSYETSAVMLSDGANPCQAVSGNSPDDLSREQKVGLQFQPADAFTLGGNAHNSSTDAALPADSSVTTGAGFQAQGKLPFGSTLTLGLNNDHTTTGLIQGPTYSSQSYDAQISQPLGKIPLTAVFKSHYEATTQAGAPYTQAPSFEQSLVWKPVTEATVQLGLRQQHYQDFPGLANEFNQALFADWSQKIMSDVTWHSYAEVLNTRGIQDQAPAVPLASGTNGTAQETTPGSNASPTSNLPVSIDDQTLTFSTGPSFRLQKDLSASIEYSNRWDRNPMPGNVARTSVFPSR